MNWGYKILCVIIAFVLGIAVMVTIAMKQTNELIDEQYYVKELQHQSLIDAAKNYQALQQLVHVQHKDSGLGITIPVVSTAQRIDSGKITLIKPDDKRKDLTLSMTLDSEQQMWISGKHLSKGWYFLKVYWEVNGKAYFTEQRIYI